MSSESITEVIETLNDVSTKIKKLDAEARRLSDLRVDLKAAANGLGSVAAAMAEVVSTMAEGAATMKALDMGTTLERLAEIEEALDTRSKELQNGLKKQLAERLDSVSAQLGSNMLNALEHHSAVSGKAFASFTSDAEARELRIAQSLREGVEQLHADSRTLSATTRDSILEMRSTLYEANRKHHAELSALTTDLAEKFTAQLADVHRAFRRSVRTTRIFSVIALVLIAAGAAALSFLR